MRNNHFCSFINTSRRLVWWFVDGGYLWASFDGYSDTMHFTHPTHLANDGHLEDVGHHWVTNLVGTLTVASLSALAHATTNDSRCLAEDKQKKLRWLIAAAGFFCAAWPYLRSCFSGFKNGNHAYVMASNLISALGHLGTHLMNPIGLALGGLLAINLIFRHYVRKKRKAAIANNKALAANIGSAEIANSFLAKPKIVTKVFYVLCAALDGLLDGLYLFGWVVAAAAIFGLHLATMGIAPLVIVTTLLVAWTLVSVISKITDELDEQRELDNSIDLVNNARIVGSLRPLAQPKINHGVFKKARSVLSAIKNGHKFVLMIFALVVKKPLASVAKGVGVAIGSMVAGLALWLIAGPKSSSTCSAKTKAKTKPTVNAASQRLFNSSPNTTNKNPQVQATTTPSLYLTSSAASLG